MYKYIIAIVIVIIILILLYYFYSKKSAFVVRSKTPIQYIEIKNLDNPVQLMEVEVNGYMDIDGKPVLQPIAYLGTANQSDTFSAYGARNAIDGNKSTMSATSFFKGMHSWSLNLNKPYVIDSIRIYYFRGMGAKMDGAEITIMDAKRNIIVQQKLLYEQGKLGYWDIKFQ
jgi:hypothetical protein